MQVEMTVSDIILYHLADCVLEFVSKRMTKVEKGHEGQYHVVGSGSPRTSFVTVFAYEARARQAVSEISWYMF